MSEQDKQRWRELCQKALSERDPQRLAKIIADANKLIEEKKTEVRRDLSELET
jgi:dephospho-CoA kinase